MLNCPSCGYSRELSPAYKNVKINCPQCGAQIIIQSENPSEQKVEEIVVGGDTKTCPFCAEKIKAEAKKCRYCGEILDKDLRVALKREKIQEAQRRMLVYKSEATGAKASLVCGILALLFSWSGTGIALGIIAIMLGNAAQKEIEKFPILKGKEWAKAGIVLGGVSIILGIIFLILFFNFYRGLFKGLDSFE